MKLIDAPSYEGMSEKGAELLLNTIRNKKDAVICLATGGSPKRMYELFVEAVNMEHIDLSEVTFVKLDEWCDIKPSDTCSCTSFIKENLLDKLYMPPKQFIEFIADAKDMKAELAKVESFLQTHPIDVMILGLGMDGHLGLNEPDEVLTLGCHEAKLNNKTMTHDMVKGFTLTHGLTIGMRGIFESRMVIMLVCGARKEEAYENFMSGDLTTQVPASFLWLHPNCITIIDKEQFYHR